MNRITDYPELTQKIVDWIDEYVNKNPVEALVVGVSGGIDSAVVSTLCAETGLPTYAVGMPIHQDAEQESLSDAHLDWLTSQYTNVTKVKFDLTNTFDTFASTMDGYNENKLALANSRSRIRMITLYQVAGSVGGIVVGTGNKVEDYGIGFYTKYGDGGVDIAPIADLYKTEVWELGKRLGVDQRIVDASPTDGLLDDGRCDEDQIGATYADLEYSMETGTGPAVRILHDLNAKNKHKMTPIPTFKL
jgi:NAD+ synthase